MLKYFFKKTNGGLKFFLIVCLLYLFMALFKWPVFSQAIFIFFNMVVRIVPLLFFVFVFSVFVNFYFNKNRVQKFFGKDSGIRAYFYAIISGILISGPPYVLYPILGEFKKKGMRNSLLAIFLYNRNVKIPFLPVLIFYFGFKYSIFLSLYIIIFSIFNGLLVNFFIDEDKIKTI